MTICLWKGTTVAHRHLPLLMTTGIVSQPVGWSVDCMGREGSQTIISSEIRFSWIGRRLSLSGSRRFEKTVRSSSGSDCSGTSWPFQMRALRSFERSETTQPTTQLLIPEGTRVTYTIIQALRLCTGRTAYRWSRRIALLFHGDGTRRGEELATHPGRSLPRESTGTHCTGGGVGSRAGLEWCGKSHPHRDSIPGPSSP